jgi:Concanavalin A-like lectin/glucanases superfamily
LLAAGCGRLDFGGVAGIDGSGSDASTPYPQAVLASGPFAYYRLGEPANAPTAVDASGNMRDVPIVRYLNGTVAPSPGALGDDTDTALAMFGEGNPGNSSAGYVDIPDPYQSAAWSGLWSKDWTIEMFVQPLAVTGDASYGLVVCEDYKSAVETTGSGFRTGLKTNNLVSFWNDEADGHTAFAATESLLPGDWHHVVVVRRMNPGSVTIYLDGVSVQSQPVTDYVPPVGMDAECGFGSFHGMPTDTIFDEVALYEKALDESAVAAHVAAWIR